MRMIKIILVGMILAALIIPLPGHTAATGDPTQASPPATAPESPAAPDEAPETAAPAEAPETSAPPADAAPVEAQAPDPAPAAGAVPPRPPIRGTGPERPGRPAPRPNGAAPQEPIEAARNGDLMLKLNFQDAPLQTVLEYLSETAGLTIVSDEPISTSRMTVISRQPITLAESVSLINTVLKEKGLTTVLVGKTLKVFTLGAVRTQIIPVVSGRDLDGMGPSDDVITCVMPIAHVTAAALRQNLQTLLPEYATVEANIDSNTLIITDSIANIRRLKHIITALDTHMASVAEIRVFRLKNADATTTATLINSIFQQQAQGGRGSSSRGGSPFGGGTNPMQMIMERMSGRGGPPGMSTAGRSGTSGGTSSQGGGSINVQVIAAADAQTNSVVVRGPSEAIALVADVIDALDDSSTKIATVRVFQLRYADALNTADVINQLFNQQASSSTRGRSTRGGGGTGGFPGGGPMQFRGPFGEGGPPGATQEDGSMSMVQVTAAADSRTNTVVVTGPEAVLNVVEEVIKKLDTPLSNVADVKVFRLEYADASNTAQLINEVFGQSRTSSSSRTSRTSGQQSQQVTFRGGFGGVMGGMMGGGGQTTTASSDIAVVASADTRTNSIVVSGPPETLEVIAQIIKDLDENPAAERRIFVYALKNSNATNLMTILNNLFQQMQTLNQRVAGARSTTTGGQRNVGTGMATMGGGATGGQTGGTGTSSSSGDTLSEETYFQADPNTNSLLIMTSSKNYDKVKPIIDELDKPVGQVLIKVLFAELTHSNNVDLGVEFSMLNLRNDGNFTQTTQAFPPAQTSGLSVRTLQGDIDITVRALQETGRLNVLSRPYVMTRNNQTAIITVAEEVPIPTGTTTQGTIGTSTTFTYRDDIGIVLQVTPSVNPDGLVNMTVTPSITTRTGETVQISEQLFPEVFATRSASTQVAVLDGQTIVIGGLIEDQIKDTVKKVPLLGDIPIAGHLFRRDIKSKSKTELLIFLTPHVAQEPQALTPISEAEQRRSSLLTDPSAAEIYRRHMDGMQNRNNVQEGPQE